MHIPFSTEEITGCTNEATNGGNEVPRYLPSCFFISCFTVSVTQSINTPESFNDFMILMSFISSFEIKKVNSHSSFSTYFSFKFYYCILSQIAY